MSPRLAPAGGAGRVTVRSLDAAGFRAIPFVLYVAFLLLREMLPGLAPSADARWLYGVQVGVVAIALALFAPRYRELADLRALPAREWLVAFVVGVAVFALWIRLDVGWLVIGESAGFDPRDESGRIVPALALMRVAGAALVVPVMEELFWRSFIARWIDRRDFLALDARALSVRALALSSLAFGFEHSLWFAGILAGLAYGGLYRASGSLWPAVIAHAVTNALLGVWVLATGNWQFW
ncbi:MAG: CAAX prenyl protease-related protein [Rhodocyclales bacterium CG_4_9_14_3_um_filter_68_10]|nr:MAG: CAAX prenyl protease-related protein [Rhodocyclales bacterium CG_4_10_14_3_um_filter_68_10]PJA58737.1 MAG: CAAX prenyl protease-related protein [Rhodocyclales bacterium CG_4_9_14_3_um_filter_68_10]